MKVCIPAATDAGLSSVPHGHFGSAPFFVVHDMGSDKTEILSNANQHHAHGACQPLSALGGHDVDAVIVGGIGAGAIGKLNASGIRVYRADAGSIEDNLKALREGALTELTPESGCQQHGGCNH
ncbi:NifB/NifX family molybdenum-iron cluster-binding protein [Candidatus Bipolaricaulota bacterium]